MSANANGRLVRGITSEAKFTYVDDSWRQQPAGERPVVGLAGTLRTIDSADLPSGHGPSHAPGGLHP